MNRFCWYQRMAAVAAALVVAAGAGYRLRDVQGLTVTKLEVAEMAPADSFVQTHSFSEIQNARAELQGLAWRYRTEARLRHLASIPKAWARSDYPIGRTTILRELERGIEEFKNTPEELVFVQDLLLQLKADGQFNRWLDVYFEVLYRQPTAELVATQFAMARRLAEATGREAEVDEGVQHLLNIPLDFPAKRLLPNQALRATAVHQPRIAGARSLL